MEKESFLDHPVIPLLGIAFMLGICVGSCVCVVMH